MERLKLDFILLDRALKSLEESFLVAREIEKLRNPLFILAAEDSMIKRFEYSYETFWKFLKKYLEFVHHIQDINSPKKVFRACVKAEIVLPDEGDIFLDMADDRNETSHKYDLDSTRIILLDIKRYHEAMLVVTHRLNPSVRAK